MMSSIISVSMNRSDGFKINEGTELTIFGQLKIPMMFSINFKSKTFRLLNCLHMIFYTVYYVTSSYEK